MIFHSITASSVGGVITPTFKPHVVISNLEHGSVALVARNLKKLGQIGEFLWLVFAFTYKPHEQEGLV